MALLREIGEVRNVGPAPIAIRWLIENDVVLPIPGAKNADQAMANAQALSFSLSGDEVQALNQATLAWRD